MLTTISTREVYGLQLLELLRGAGITPLGDPSVYGVLRRLEQDGLVTSHLVPSAQGPARKYFAITEQGRLDLAAAVAEWTRLTRAVDRLLEMKPDDES